MANLRLSLKQLHGCLPHDASGHSIDVSQANLHSGDVAKRALESCHIENACSALFDENYGIITFLRKSVNSNELQLSKLKILEFIPQFINKAGKTVLPYAVAIKDVCLWIYLSDKSAKSRNAVLAILLAVLKLCSGNAIGHELQPDKIIDRFYLDLTASKTSSSVKQNIFHLLGVIAQSFPEYASDYSRRFQSVFCSNLKAQMNAKSKDSDFPIIAGCLLGLNSLLFKFPCKPDEADEIFSYVRRAINYNRDFKYLVPKAGLKIIFGHAALFKLQMYDNYSKMYENIHSWSTIGHPETSKMAFGALDKFFQQVAEVVCDKISANTNDPQTRKVFLFFLEKFKNIFKMTTSRSVTVAIKGYGYFAAACKLFWNTEEVNVMFVQVLRRCEELFLSQSDSSKETMESYLQYLPSFVEALASIVTQLDKVPEMFQLDLQNLVIFLIENFPRVIPVYQFLCYNSIIKLLAALFPRASTFKTFVHNSVYQGIVRTCSHEIPFVGNGDDVNAMKNLKSITYKSYMPLWTNLLNAVHIKELNDQGVPLDVRQAVTDAMYDEIVESVLIIIAKLDLSCSKVAVGEIGADETPTSNPITGLRASNPKDFQIFVNIVDFCRSLWLENHVNNFSKWVFRFGNDVTSLSTKHPLVSGFYKLLGMCFKICSLTKHFWEIKQIGSTKAESGGPLNEKAIIFKLFSKYAVEITFRLLQYKEDLLASCLEAILSLPCEIIADETVLKSIIPAVCMSFRMGVSYMPLADHGLTAMETWGRRLSHTELLPLYREVLPLLNSFLKSTAKADGGDDAADTQKPKSKSSFNEVLKGEVKRVELNRGQPLVDVQIKLRIMRLLGSIGNGMNRHIVSILPNPELAVAWDSHKHLKFAVPFADMKPVVYLDCFLPRVVDLACSSSNRQIKVTAAEMLHAMVLYTLGCSASKSAVMQHKLPTTKLYRKILPAMLQLACDVDLVTKQLFEPLVMQIIHWFSNNKKGEDDVGVLVDALMEGIVSTTDSALRDFCGRCLCEFMVWSIKQSTPKEQETNPHNARSLLGKIYSMCLHPSSFQRLGAALAFNSIYAVLREEAALVDTFIFEILYHFVECLALSQKDEEQMGARQQCLLALDHVQRIVLVKSALLCKVSSKRRIPTGFTSGTLSGAVEWLLLQCGRSEIECRHRCMHLVYHLCVGLPSSPPIYFQRTFEEHGVAYFVSIFEGSVESARERPSLRSAPTLQSFIIAPFSIGQILRWFDLLLASLDCYMWVFNAKLLKPELLFSGSCTSSLSLSFQDFLDNVATKDLTQKMEEYGYTDVLTPRTTATYSRAKCTVIIRCLDFVQALIQPSSVHSDVIHKFVGDSFWKLVLRCILRPLSVGFDMTDAEVLHSLPVVTGHLLNTTNQRADLSTIMAKTFNRLLKDAADEYDLFDKLNKITDQSQICVIDLRLLVDGYIQLLGDRILLTVLGKTQTENEDLVSRLLKTAWDMCAVEQPDGVVVARMIDGSYLNLGTRLVSLALSLNKNLETITYYLLNAEPIALDNSSGSIEKGIHFYVAYKAEINLYLIKNHVTTISYLMRNMQRGDSLATNMLLGMFDSLITSRDMRKTYGPSVNKVVCSDWDKLHGWCVPQSSEERKTLILHLLKKMFIVDTTFSLTTEFAMPLDTYLIMLVDKTTSLKFKSGVLNLLAFFTKLTGTQLVTLNSHLVQLAGHHFPLKSSELQPSSSAYSDYAFAFRKILTALQLSSNLMLFKFVVELTCIEDYHILEDELQESIVAFLKRVTPSEMAEAIRFPFAIFTDEQSKPADVRKSALKRFCLPLLNKINLATLHDFFEENIGAVMNTIQTKNNQRVESTFVSQLVSKAGCFKLMELLYRRGTKEQLVTVQSKVNCAFLKSQIQSGKLVPGKEMTGKELTQEISKTAHLAKKENVHVANENGDVRLEYQCAAYNALVSVIRCTQTDVKFYTVFLFKEDLGKGEYLWDNIVDSSKTYVFEMELDVPIEKRQILKNTRYEARTAARTGDETDDDIDSSYPLTIRQLTTQNLASSSLAEDVSQFDFTSAEVHYEPGTIKLRPEPLTEAGERTVEEYFEMEMDDLNKHSCMASLASLLHHLSLKVTPPPSDQEVNVENTFPPWMKCIKDKFVADGTHKNVKLFIARLIVNNEKIFRPYAKLWLLPLMQFVASGVTGAGLNYFVTDVVTVMLSWHSIAIPEDSLIERAMASRVLEFLMQNAYHLTRKILRNNLEIIKTLVECWKTRLDMPYKVIYDNLSDPLSEKLTNLVGLQFVGIMLSCGLTLLPTGAVDGEKFLKTLAENVNFKSKEVYECAAEVCGMTLKQLSEKTKSNDFPFHGIVKDKLLKLRDGSKDKFLICLHRIQSFYPPIVDNFMSNILFMLPQLHGIFKEMALEIVMSCLERIDNAYQELNVIGLDKFLVHGDTPLQIISLKLINKMLPQLTSKQILDLQPPFVQLATHENAICRKIVFDVFIWIHDHYSNRTNPAEPVVVSNVKSLLLLGLVDQDHALRLTVLNFWGNKMSSATHNRMVNLVTDMYLPITEHHYLGYCTNLLLELTSKSPDFNRTIFESPLSDCKFQDYVVSISWRSRHASMVPLFVETPSSQMGSAEVSVPLQQAGQIRATQDNLEFAPTQDPDSKRPFNWLTQNTFDPSVNMSASLSDTNQSSLMFKPRNPFQPRDRAAGHQFGGGTKKIANDNRDGADEVYSRLMRRRFVKDSDASKYVFRKHHARQKKQLEELEKNRLMARESQVTMYRQYRVGDFPDILIPHSAIIAPLQALAQVDSEIAQMLFTALSTGIFEETKKVTTDEEWTGTVSIIKSGFDDILSNSKTYNRFVVSFILEFYYDNCAHFKLDLEPLMLALKHCGQSIGTLLLEKMIMQGDSSEATPAKRARQERPSPDADKALWLNLAELNKGQGHFEVTRAIFAHKISTCLETKEALQAEELQDYSTALKKYKDVDKKFKAGELTSEQVDLAEVDLWEGSILKCYDCLTQWDSLCNFVQTGDNLDHLWSDITYQELHLPYVVRGKLKMIMNGADGEQTFIKFLNDSLLINGRQQFLESRHPEELALLSVVQQDYNRARYYQDMCAESFLRDWSGLSQLNSTGHKHLLSRVQKLVEMDEFLHVMKCSLSNDDPALRLIKTWNKRLPISTGDMVVTSDIVDNRLLYMKIMENHSQSRDNSLNAESQMEIDLDSTSGCIKRLSLECKLSLSLLCVNTCQTFNNMKVAFKHLKKSFELSNKLNDDTKRVQCYHAYTKAHLQFSKSNPDGRKMSNLLSVWDQLYEKVDNGTLLQRTDLNLQHLGLLSSLAEHFVDNIENDADLLDAIPSEKRANFFQRINSRSQNIEEVVGSLTRYSYDRLTSAVSLAADHPVECGAVAQFHLAVFCDRHLRQGTEGVSRGSLSRVSADEFATILMTNLLDAIHLGSQEAVQLFPRLLQLLEEYPHTRDIFIEKVNVIPCWVLLRWSSQLVALLDKPVASAIHNLLTNMAEEYPHALIYPFRVSKKGLVFDDSNCGKQNRAVVEKIDGILSRLWLVDHFMLALEHLSVPGMDYKDQHSRLSELFVRDRDAFLESFKNIYNSIFVKPLENTNVPVPYGKFKKSFAKNYRSLFEQQFGQKLTKLNTMSSAKFLEAQLQIFNKLQDIPLPNSLRDYCDWLADFQQSKYGMELEVPGQYDGLRKPMPEYHIKIAKFGDGVLVMKSIRKPKRIVIYGNDYKEHKMLIKNGEDLRTDQRIEQLFQIMNQIYDSSITSRDKELKIVTYQVIPLNDRLGMLEWLDNTIPLKEFFESNLTDEERNVYLRGEIQYCDWLKKEFKSDYRILYEKCKPELALRKYKELLASVPKYLLRTAFLKMSTGIEAFLSLRTHFIKSHAVMCISQYILGIGDRHTSNMLVCQKTGAIVGIDFGHAFGTATQFLPIPELIPIRLTPQFLNLMDPMREHGLLESTMVHAMSALRNNPSVLLSTMDVFIKEPTLDWINFAKKQKLTSNKNDTFDSDWFPRQKIDVAKRKLLGDNSAYLMKEELELGHSKSSSLSKLQNLCLGKLPTGSRKQFAANGLPVETQIACLLSHATDELIFAHTFRGWMPWM